MYQFGFFDEEARLTRLSQLGDSLERLKIIDWTLFNPILNKAFAKEKKSKGGRPPFEYLMMFKILVLQRLFNLSDDQAEYQINDRMSFMRFLGLSLGNKVPDAKTIWLFRDTLTNSGAMGELFALFNRQLEERHVITHAGTIVDASFVDAPRQRNNRDENKTIKDGSIPEDWVKPENRNKLHQKDTDARWMTKGGERHYGYKDHVKVDADSKIITQYSVTSASVHDSQVFLEFINQTDRVIYADSAYSGDPISTQLPMTIENRIHEKGYRGRPLTETQKNSNREKSQTRARIEHVFGFMTNSMKGLTIRSIGKKRAEFNIGLTNLLYNICRYTFLERKVAVTG